jgi:outer membrane receptor for ferrienterochelin and colicins
VTTGVVTRDEAARRVATNVGEALAGEPGLQVNPAAYGYLGNPAGVQIQGLDAERVLILRDGERVIGDAGGVIDLASFSLSGVDRIEYVAGPTSSLYGTGALGGVVNIISGPPPVEGPSASLRLQGQSQPAFSVAGTAAHRGGAAWGSMDASYRANGGVRWLPDRPDYAIAPAQRLALGVKLGREGQRLDSLVSGSWTREHTEGLTTTEVPGLGRYSIALPETTDRISLSNVERLRWPGGSQLQSSLGVQWFAGNSARDRQDSPLDERRTRVQSLLSGELVATLADGPRTWVFGVHGEREAFEQALVTISAEQGELQTTELAEVPPVRMMTGALFAQLAWKLVPELVVVPGLRAEYHSRFGPVLAPRLAAAWFPTDRVRVRASVGTGFRAPSAKEFGFFFDHSSLGYRVLGNSELKPETSIGSNLELALRATRDIDLKASGFVNVVRNLISTEFQSQAPNGVDDHVYTNVGRAQTAGFHASISWSLGALFRSQLAYDFLFSRNEDDGRPLPSRPPHTCLAAVFFRPLPQLEFTYRQRLVSAAFVADSMDSPATMSIDGRVAYQIVTTLQAYVGVLNVLDQRQDPLRPGDQRSVTGRQYVMGLEGEMPGGD